VKRVVRVAGSFKGRRGEKFCCVKARCTGMSGKSSGENYFDLKKQGGVCKEKYSRRVVPEKVLTTRADTVEEVKPYRGLLRKKINKKNASRKNPRSRSF